MNLRAIDSESAISSVKNTFSLKPQPRIIDRRGDEKEQVYFAVTFVCIQLHLGSISDSVRSRGDEVVSPLPRHELISWSRDFAGSYPSSSSFSLERQAMIQASKSAVDRERGDFSKRLEILLKWEAVPRGGEFRHRLIVHSCRLSLKACNRLFRFASDCPRSRRRHYPMV